MFGERPFVAVDVIADVNLLEITVEEDVQLEPVVGPRPKLQMTGLLVEGEVRDVDGAGALEDRLRDPEHRTIARNDRHRIPVLLRTGVGAINTLRYSTSFF